MPEDQRPPEALTLLGLGEVELKGRMPWSSNATFLTTVCHDGVAFDAIYKPLAGERPLWDFPSGLYLREVAAYAVSELLGWGLVSETIVRHDAPHGVGSLQRFIPADFAEHYFTLLEHAEHHQALRRIAAFDLVINNADRKSGHCLLGEDGRVWGIDHGVAFGIGPRLRTVIWDFAGEPIPGNIIDDLLALDPGDVRAGLADLLDEHEIDAVLGRVAEIAQVGHFPNPDHDRRPYPWPLV
ncbi:MAG: SCO1664 family protein [Acidimicrobiales bacterium]